MHLGGKEGRLCHFFASCPWLAGMLGCKGGSASAGGTVTEFNSLAVSMFWYNGVRCGAGFRTAVFSTGSSGVI